MINFMDAEHEKFFYQHMPRVDSSQTAYFYLIGVCQKLRQNLPEIYDLKNRCIRTDNTDFLAKLSTTERHILAIAKSLWLLKDKGLKKYLRLDNIQRAAVRRALAILSNDEEV